MKKAHALLFSPALCVFFVGASFVILYLYKEWQELPPLHPEDLFTAEQSLIIEDKNGGELFRFYDNEDRVFIRLDDLPAFVPQAFIAIEDKRFFTRTCIDIRALTRAALANASSYKSQGASTITQQLMRTVYLDRSKTVQRKVREVMLACKLETLLSKKDILEQYLNWVSFGHGIGGVEQASKRFFGISSKELSPAQAAVLAALPQRPSYLSPYGSHRFSGLSNEARKILRDDQSFTLSDEDVEYGLIGSAIEINGSEIFLRGRADTVLTQMHEQGYLDDKVFIAAAAELQTMQFEPNTLQIRAPHFTLSVKSQIDALQEIEPDIRDAHGLRVRTTLDPSLQSIAEQVVESAAERLRSLANANNVALLALDSKTLEVRAYVGNADYFDDAHQGQIDIITTPRAVGSAMKPFIYAQLLELGNTPDTVILDTPISTDIYTPAPTGYYGKMTIRTALARSRNTPAIRAFYDIGGEDAALSVLDRVGIYSPSNFKAKKIADGYPFEYSWTLVLGAAEASMLELLQAFGSFARDGFLRQITHIESIGDIHGNVLLVPEPVEKRVFLTSTAQEMRSILSDENAREPLWTYWMHLPYGPAAIKTGTATICGYRNFFGSCRLLLPTSDWAIGFTDDLIVGVWVGNATNEPMFESAASIMAAMPVWQEFMIRAHDVMR